MKKVGRLIAFGVALAAIVAAVVAVAWFVTRTPSGGGAGTSPGLPALDDLAIKLYLDTMATELNQPAGDDDTPVSFVVQPGETAGGIAARLEQEGLISDAQLFRRYVQYHGLDAGIEAGEFTLQQTMTIPQIAQALQKGQGQEQMVTIPEGLRLEQIATVVAEQTSIPREEFMALVTTGWRERGFAFDFLADLPPTATLEGFLFPDTYRLPEEAAAGDLLGRMLETFDARVTAELQVAAADRGFSTYELITLASIVEREAVLEEERALIAGVYHNRLAAGWLLNADPTVQYAITSRPDGPDAPDTEEWWPVLSLNDLEFDSPYNSYRYPGLPPGPICSPGLASIQAAAYPTDTDYFYFLADCTRNDGSHLFAVTEAEHLANYQMCGGSP